MKRILTIGRDYSCDIHIDDNTDIVSRHHAVVEVGRFGKYYVTDQSRNGTYVNGMRIPSQQKYEITRGDEVSLAHTALLDWGLVPKDNTLMYIFIGIVSTLLIVAAVVLGVSYFDGKSSYSESNTEWIGGSGDDVKVIPGEDGEDDSSSSDDKKDEDKSAQDTTKKESSPKKNSKKPAKKPATKKADSEEKAVVDAIY